MNEEPANRHSRLAVDRIREKVRALIRPSPLDFLEAGRDAMRGIHAETTRLRGSLLETRDRGRAAATRLSVIASDPNKAPSPRYDDLANKHGRSK